MSFLRNLFGGKDSRTHLDKGNRLLAEGRYAEARFCYDDALERLGSDETSLRDEIMARMGEAGDALAVINLEEAERCLAEGEADKARVHLDLAREFAVTSENATRVTNLSRRLSDGMPIGVVPRVQDVNCGSCASGSLAPTQEDALSVATDGHLSSEERFELMTAALPEDLPVRYRALGSRFAQAYLLVHDGDDTAAAQIFASITIPAFQDIILYERALIVHRQGEMRGCEKLLRESLSVNDRNPLCCMALVDLWVTTDRAGEALNLLDYMIAAELMPIQAIMTKGDIQEHLGMEEGALASYALLLETPGKKDAAIKIIPILEKLGRSEEARHVFKQYVKGCC